MTKQWTRSEVQALPTHDLRVIVRGTNPDGDLKIELSWAREELERRDAKHNAWKRQADREAFNSRMDT